MTKLQPRYNKGDKIGDRYQVHQALMGGMGEVYLCLDLEQNYPYALKTFQKRHQSEALRQAFETEVATWVSLEKHANIVRCFHMDILDYQPFMVLEWVAGEESKGVNLREWLGHGPLELKIALDIAIDICRGLTHGIEKQPGLVHRDLKPANILIAQGRQAKITDFGLAQIVAGAGLAATDLSEQTDFLASDPSHSLMGGAGVVGTPPYMPPEQWHAGIQLDVRTDIYTFGIILYEMLVGHHPFKVDIIPSTLDNYQRWLSAWQYAHEYPTRLAFPACIPASLVELLTTCLSPDREARPQGVKSLLQELLLLYQQLIDQPPSPVLPMNGFTANDYNNRGLTYKTLGQYEAALADYDQALQLDPQLVQVYNNRGLIYKALGQCGSALADYDQAIFLNSQYVNAYNNRGLTYDHLGQYKDSLADYNHAIRLNPQSAEAYNNRGNTYQKLGQYEAALADFNKTLRLNPKLADTYFNRGNTYQILGQYDATLADFGQALRLNPQYVEAYINRGSIYHHLGQYEDALADFDQALRLNPQHTFAYLKKGGLLAMQGRLQEALPNFEMAEALGDIQAAQFADQIRRQMLIEKLMPAPDLTQQAFAAFQQTGSPAEMVQVVIRFPFMTDEAFIIAVQQFIKQYILPEHGHTFEHQLDWLQQIAKENKK